MTSPYQIRSKVHANANSARKRLDCLSFDKNGDEGCVKIPDWREIIYSSRTLKTVSLQPYLLDGEHLEGAQFEIVMLKGHHFTTITALACGAL
jgi:hypothetical protein